MKFSKFGVLLLFATLLLNMQCNDDDDNQSIAICDDITTIDNDLYQNAPTAFYTFTNVEIIDNCLFITVSASGCSGNSWELKLIGSEGIMESSPVQRNIKAVLNNNEACLAVFSKAWSFDLTALQVDGEHQVVLNLQDYSEPIIYTY